MIGYKDGDDPVTISSSEQHEIKNENMPENDEAIEDILSGLQSGDRKEILIALECLINRLSHPDIIDERWFEPNIVESIIMAFSDEMPNRHVNFIMKFCRKAFTEEKDLEQLLTIDQNQFFSIMFSLFQYRGTLIRNQVFKMLLTLLENRSVSEFFCSQIFESEFLSLIFDSSKFEMDLLVKMIPKIDRRSEGNSIKSNSRYFELLFRFITNIICLNDGSFDTDYMKNLLSYSYFLFDGQLGVNGIFGHLRKADKVNLIISIVQLYDVLVQDVDIRAEMKEIIDPKIIKLVVTTEDEIEILPPIMTLLKHYVEYEGPSAVTPYLVNGAATCLVDNLKASQEMFDLFLFLASQEEMRPILYECGVFDFAFSGLGSENFISKENNLMILCEALTTAEPIIVEGYVEQGLFDHIGDLITHSTAIAGRAIDTIGQIVSKFPHLAEKVSSNEELMEAIQDIADREGDDADIAEQLISLVSPVGDL